MPAPVDPQIVESAYTMWRQGRSLPDIAGELDTTVRALENWRTRHQWVQRRDVEDADKADTKRYVMSSKLIEKSPELMNAAIDLALNAESESVRAQQQRYLLGTLGFSPDTATERIKQLEAKADQLRLASRAEVIDVDAVSSRLTEKIDWEEP